MMKVMAFGNKTTVRKLTESLKGIGVELVSLTEVSEMIALLKQETFALVLVDSLAVKTEAVCHDIRELSTIPLVLIVNERKADWKRLESLGADGYLPEAAGKNELVARFRVMRRRFFIIDKLRKLDLQPDASEPDHTGMEAKSERLVPNFSET